jgi:hypothetical protein
VGVLHYVPDAVAAEAMRRYREVLAPGSGVAISHLTGVGRPDVHTWSTINHGGWSYAPTLRDPEDMDPWLEGLELVGPGWASAPHWRPEGAVPRAEETASGLWGVVARRPLRRG